MEHKPFRLTAKLEVEKNGICFLSFKSIELLKLIHSTGSILAASKIMRISYQQAWTIVHDLNALGALPVVLRRRGGTTGGGTELTKYGQRLVQVYEEVQALHRAYLVELELRLDCCF
ncbi:MAG: LysR family transcriptional regulator [Bacteroidales bacterium]|jgi:molybdate transport system regulatory protein|nr:LysR family transcriptional regulator [Bacteroidales bacterium]